MSLQPASRGTSVPTYTLQKRRKYSFIEPYHILMVSEIIAAALRSES